MKKVIDPGPPDKILPEIRKKIASGIWYAPLRPWGFTKKGRTIPDFAVLRFGFMRVK